METEEYVCRTCGAGPFRLEEQGNFGNIINFHKEQGHQIIEYREKPKDIFQRDIWNDEDRENFKKFLRKERLLKSGGKS